MSGVNKAIIVGNLGVDPEIRFTSSNHPVANLRIATNEVWKDRDGQRQERTEWHRVVAFGRLAELARDYLRKGRQVYVEGRIQTREWQDRDGNRRFTTEIVAGQIVFLGGGEGGRGRGGYEEPPPPSGPSDYGLPEDRFYGGGSGGGHSGGSGGAPRGTGGGGQPRGGAPAVTPPAPQADPGVVEDDDIPF